MKVLVTQSCLTLCDPMDCSPPGFSIYGDSPGKNTGVSCHALLQRIFWTRVSCIAGRLLTIWATREPHLYWSYPSSLLLTPKLGAITSSPVFSYHFSLYDSILGFLYHVFFFFFLHSLGTSGAVWDTQQVCRKQLPDWKTVSAELVIIPKGKWTVKAARK